jgi:class 3 adenylate cyclase/tetratricopeptide (TPR) repeat protein
VTARPPGTLTTATVLFTDVVDSTRTRTSLGEELADDHFRRHEQLLRAVVAAHGAIFVKGLGDGLMALFSSATVALEASAAIEQAVEGENEYAVAPVAVRAALSAGDVRWADDDVSGLPVIEAARLVDVALGGQVLCTDLVRRLAQGRGQHEFKELGPVSVSGLGEPLQVCELRWQSGDRDPDGQLPPWLRNRYLLPFVGRSEELATLDDALHRARFGARVIVLDGASGTGKTRLASVLARKAARQGFTVLAGRCTDPPRQAYQPVAAAIEWLSRAAPELLLRAGVDEQCGPLARLAPSLTAPPLALSVPPTADPVTDRYQMLASLRVLVRRLTQVRPVLFVLDDLHWATPESIEMVRALSHDTEGMALLIMAITRPVAVESAPVTARGLRKLEAESRRITLGSLSEQDVARALASRPRRGPAGRGQPGVTAARLHAITGGNAFLVTEMIRDLPDRVDLETWDVPESVSLVVAARMAQLSPAARELVNLLGVGEQLEPAALSLAMGVTEAGFVTAIEEAMAAGLVAQAPGGPCQFTHELTRSAVCAALSAPRAGLLHGVVADALRAADPAVMRSRPYAVAAHLVSAAQLGGRPERFAEAADAAGQAARDAISRLAYQEAVTWYQRLLELAEHVPAITRERRAELLVECGRTMWLASHPDAGTILLRAADLARACHRPDLVVAAALAADRGFFSLTGAADAPRIGLLTEARELVPAADLGRRALLTAMLAAELTWAPDGERRFALSDEAVALARRSGDPRTIVSVLGLRSLTITAADTIDARRRDAEEMQAAAAGVGDELALFHATFQQTGPALELGDVTTVAGLLERADGLARLLAQPHLIWLVSFSRAGLAIMLGDLDDAEEQVQAALALGVTAGRRMEALAFGAEQTAEIRRLQGRLGELGAGLRRAAPQLDPVHATLRYLVELDPSAAGPVLDGIVATSGLIPRRDPAERAALDNLALTACRLNRRDLADPLYAALEPFASTFGHSAVGHHCGHYYLAHLAVTRGDADRAAAHFAAAAELHDRRKVPLLLAESLLDWADAVDRGQSAGPRPEALRGRAAGTLAGRPAGRLEQRVRLVTG